MKAIGKDLVLFEEINNAFMKQLNNFKLFILGSLHEKNCLSMAKYKSKIKKKERPKSKVNSKRTLFYKIAKSNAQTHPTNGKQL